MQISYALISVFLLFSFLSGLLGGLIGVYVYTPSFAVVNLSPLLKKQVSLLQPQKIEEKDMEKGATHAHQTLKDKLTVWSHAHNTILFSQQNLLGGAPEVTQELLKELEKPS